MRKLRTAASMVALGLAVLYIVAIPCAIVWGLITFLKWVIQ